MRSFAVPDFPDTPLLPSVQLPVTLSRHYCLRPGVHDVLLSFQILDEELL